MRLGHEVESVVQNRAWFTWFEILPSGVWLVEVKNGDRERKRKKKRGRQR